MVDPKIVSQQLRETGCDYAFWGRTETRELCTVLMDNERIMQAVNGYYDGGFALLCITNYRVLVVDKKPFLLSVEDLRYDMIAEVDFSSRIFTSVLHVYTPLRTLVFTSWSTTRLRKSMNYIQQRVMEVRNNDFISSQFMPQTQTNEQPPVRVQIPKSPFKSRTQHIPQMVPTYHGVHSPLSEFDGYDVPEELYPNRQAANSTQAQVPQAPIGQSQRAKRLMNPYTKVPLLARRRKYPSFY